MEQGLELDKSRAVEKVPDEYILQPSGDNKYLISIFYKSFCLNKIGEIDKSELYFNFFEKLFKLIMEDLNLILKSPLKLKMKG